MRRRLGYFNYKTRCNDPWVAAVINEDIHLELLELLELYCELLLARFGLLDQKYTLDAFDSFVRC